MRKRTIVVVGYSGLNDPVFKHLSAIPCFDNKLFWVGYKDNDPEEYIQKGILESEEKYSYYLKGYDADGFFLELSKKLEVSEPQILAKPFSYLEELLDNIAEFEFEGKKADLTKESIKWINHAKRIFENGEPFATVLPEKEEEIKSDEIIKLARDSWINDIRDNYQKLEEVITENSPEEARKYFSYFLNNWGASLGDLARQKEGQEAEEIYQEAFLKFERAVEIRPDGYEAYCNWGTNLGRLAKQKEGKEAEELYQEAFLKFEKAIEIKPDYHEAYCNWGSELLNLAKQKEGKERVELFDRSIGLLLNAEKLKQGAGAYNLACFYNVMGRKEDALEWLDKSIKFKTAPELKFILEDEDLQSIVESEEFNNILTKYKLR